MCSLLANLALFSISSTRAHEFFSAFLFVFGVWPRRCQVREDGETESPPLIKCQHIPFRFYVHFPKGKSRWHRLSLCGENLLCKFLLKWKSGDSASSAVTAHSHNGQDGKIFGREGKPPGGIISGIFITTALGQPSPNPAGRTCGPCFILYIAGAGSKVMW